MSITDFARYCRFSRHVGATLITPLLFSPLRCPFYFRCHMPLITLLMLFTLMPDYCC